MWNLLRVTSDESNHKLIQILLRNTADRLPRLLRNSLCLIQIPFENKRNEFAILRRAKIIYENLLKMVPDRFFPVYPEENDVKVIFG